MIHRLVFSWRGALLGVLAGLAMVGFAVPAAASAASPGNSGAAHTCQQGGYVNYGTTSGTAFRNTGECVSYAAQGGTLVPLPDIALVVDCSPFGGFSPGQQGEQCTFGVKNVGIGTANGLVTLTAHLTMDAPQGTSASLKLSSKALGPTCDPASADATVTASCNLSLAPGATAPLSDFSVGIGAAAKPGPVTVQITASATPSFLVSHTNDETFSQTFTFTGT